LEKRDKGTALYFCILGPIEKPLRQKVEDEKDSADAKEDMVEGMLKQTRRKKEKCF